MNYKKMKRMLEAGEDPIDVSIEKWREILRSVKNSQYVRAHEQDANCALCYVNGHACFRCPLKSCTRNEDFYDKAMTAVINKEFKFLDAGTKQETIKAVENMIQTLEDLKA